MRDEEAGLIAALLRDCSPTLELELSPEDFSDGHGAGMYRALLNLATRGVTVDPHTLGSEYGDQQAVIPWFDPQGPSGSPDNAKHYAHAIKQASRLRQIEHAARNAAEQAREGGDPDSIMDGLMDGVATTETRQDVWEMSELQRESLSELMAARERQRQGGIQGIPTGFGQLDRMLTGLRGGRLYVVGARPKMGKTSLALSIQHTAARAGYSVGFASAEMGALECNYRWLSAVSGVEFDKLQSAKLTDDDEYKIAQASARLAELPIHILDKAAASPARIRRQALRWQQRYGLDLLMVDYLQRLTPDGTGERRDLQVGAMARAFKNVARDLNIPVVLLAQLNRGVEQREDKRPMPSDLRDSGEIEQEVDALGFIYRDAVYNENADPLEAELLLPMNRHGQAGRAHLKFDGRFQRWMDRDIAEYEAEERYV